MGDTMSDIFFNELDKRIGCITLNRQSAKNALTHEMCLLMTQHLKRWASDSKIKAVVIRAIGDRTFCSGGDVKELYDKGRAHDPYPQQFLKDEYALNHLIFSYPKPYIALLDGFFPDIGASYFLSRCQGYLGFYLGLTGARIKADDLLYLGLGTHFIPQRALNDFLAHLSSQSFKEDDHHAVVEQAIAEFSLPANTPPLIHAREWIDHCFSGANMEVIFQYLAEQSSEWAEATLLDLKKRSPTSLKVTLKLFQENAEKDFMACQQTEYIVACHFMEHPDFYEGVRAQLIDKDQNPRWQPATLEDVLESQLEEFFRESV